MSILLLIYLWGWSVCRDKNLPGVAHVCAIYTLANKARHVHCHIRNNGTQPSVIVRSI